MSRPLAIIVTADDFGIGRETSRGIVDAHLRGPLTATSAMTVTGDHLRRSIPLLEQAPNLEIGLHVVLTRCGHQPLVATRTSGLVARDGQFHTNGQLWMRAFMGRLNGAAVAEEIAAQAEQFRREFGRPPAYVDSHHHSHQLPTIREALIDVIKSGALPGIVRTTVEFTGMRHIPSVRLRRRAANFIGRPAARAFAGAGFWTNDYFFGMLAPEDFDRDFPWQLYLDALPTEGTVEWIVHPGYRDDSLRGRDDYRAERTTELARLTDPANRPAWEKWRDKLARKSMLSRQIAENCG
jgi:chitin disaccharide deacetylase